MATAAMTASVAGAASVVTPVSPSAAPSGGLGGGGGGGNAAVALSRPRGGLFARSSWPSAAPRVSRESLFIRGAGQSAGASRLSLLPQQQRQLLLLLLQQQQQQKQQQKKQKRGSCLGAVVAAAGRRPHVEISFDDDVALSDDAEDDDYDGGADDDADKGKDFGRAPAAVASGRARTQAAAIASVAAPARAAAASAPPRAGGLGLREPQQASSNRRIERGWGGGDDEGPRRRIKEKRMAGERESGRIAAREGPGGGREDVQRARERPMDRSLGAGVSRSRLVDLLDADSDEPALEDRPAWRAGIDNGQGDDRAGDGRQRRPQTSPRSREREDGARGAWRDSNGEGQARRAEEADGWRDGVDRSDGVPSSRTGRKEEEEEQGQGRGEARGVSSSLPRAAFGRPESYGQRRSEEGVGRWGYGEEQEFEEVRPRPAQASGSGGWSPLRWAHESVSDDGRSTDSRLAQNPSSSQPGGTDNATRSTESDARIVRCASTSSATAPAAAATALAAAQPRTSPQLPELEAKGALLASRAREEEQMEAQDGVEEGLESVAKRKIAVLDCVHFDSCSGCSLSHDLGRPPLLAEAEAFCKAFGAPDFELITPMTTEWRCRAKLVVRGTAKEPILGLFEKGSHNAVDIPFCRTHHPRLNEVCQLLREVLRELEIPPYDEATGVGLLRYVQLVLTTHNTSLAAVHRYAQGRVQLSLVWNARDERSPQAASLALLAKELWRRAGPGGMGASSNPSSPPLLHSIWANFQTSQTNVIFGHRWRHMLGEGSAWEQYTSAVDTLLVPGGFGQANYKGFGVLLKLISKCVPQGSSVTELYAGSGVIGLTLAARRRCRRVRCVEVNRESQHAFEQSLARLPPAVRQSCRVSWHCSDASLSPLKWLRGSEVVVVDPPRKGLDHSVMEALCHAGALASTALEANGDGPRPQTSRPANKVEKRPWRVAAQRRGAGGVDEERDVSRGGRGLVGDARLEPWLLADEDVLATTLIYVSCGWEAFKRDTVLLTRDNHWHLAEAVGVNFFPGTDSIETLAIFRAGPRPKKPPPRKLVRPRPAVTLAAIAGTAATPSSAAKADSSSDSRASSSATRRAGQPGSAQSSSNSSSGSSSKASGRRKVAKRAGR